MSVRHINARDIQPQLSEPTTQEVIEIDESTGNIASVHTEANPHAQPPATGDKQPLASKQWFEAHAGDDAGMEIGAGAATDDKQEWTPEMVRCLFELRGYIYKEEGWKAISDQINAAITAHEQAWVKVLNKIASEYAQDMIAAQLELDAKREEKEESIADAKGFWNDCLDLRHQLAAERELHETEQTAAAIECGRLDRELLQAQSAIAEVVNQVPHFEFVLTIQGREIWLHDFLKSVDLSALDKHDAIVRKPLVDLLTRLQPYQTPDDAKIIADALAKFTADAKTDRA